MQIDILIEAPEWDGLDDLAARACPAALTHLGLNPAQFELSVLACDDDRIAALNADFRGKPKPTNVLSWPATDLTPPEAPTHGELGDIALAFGVCHREAVEQGKPFDDHVTHLLVHSVLHLLGYDHETDAEARQMEAIETAVLATLGIPDPY